MISPGEKLNADFALKIVREGVESSVVFRELLTRRTIVSVHMKNNTPSCDRQIDALAEHAVELERLGYNVIALSRDTCGSHRRYAAKKGLRLTLASDPEDAFARAADAIVEKSMYGRTFSGPARSAFVLDRDGTVLAMIEKVDTKDFIAQLRAALAGL